MLGRLSIPPGVAPSSPIARAGVWRGDGEPPSVTLALFLTFISMGRGPLVRPSPAIRTLDAARHRAGHRLRKSLRRL